VSVRRYRLQRRCAGEQVGRLAGEKNARRDRSAGSNRLPTIGDDNSLLVNYEKNGTGKCWRTCSCSHHGAGRAGAEMPLIYARAFQPLSG
jgi:hypothetical protein